jgi:hypothetical protein
MVSILPCLDAGVERPLKHKLRLIFVCRRPDSGRRLPTRERQKESAGCHPGSELHRGPLLWFSKLVCTFLFDGRGIRRVQDRRNNLGDQFAFHFAIGMGSFPKAADGKVRRLHSKS